MTALEYRIVRAANGKPLVELDSPLGNGQEIFPDDLRRLAAELLKIADQADAKYVGKGWLVTKGKTEY